MSDTKNSSSGNKTKLFLLTAVIFALFAGAGTMLYLKILEHNLKKELTPPPQSMESVVVASKDLPAGSRIDSSTMALRKVPRKYVESDAVTPGQFDSVKGAVLNKALGQGKILSKDYIDIKLPVDFSGTIQDGYRAMTIEVSALNGISGLIRPGNHIDLFSRLAARSDPNQSGATGEIVIPVLEDVTVLATDRKAARPNIDEFHNIASEKPVQVYSTLTLEVSPRQAALVAVAKSRGSLLAALRNTKDRSRAKFGRISTSDLFRNSTALRNAAEVVAKSGGLTGIHRNKKGQLVTADGTVITAHGVHLNNKGQLVTANGTVLNGHGLTVGPDGKIHDADGRVIDTASLHRAKDGALVDKNGTVASASPYKKLKGGFLENSRGQVLLPNGKVLTGVTVDKDGTVRGPDGKRLTASAIRVDGKGHVYQLPAGSTALHVAADGSVTSTGKPVSARDLLKVGKDGVIRSRDGKILKGWKVGKDGTLYNAQGKKATAADVLLAEKGLHKGDNGVLLNKNGKPVTARDLLTVGKDGVVRTKNGKILKGWHVGKDGAVYNAAGKRVTAEDALLADSGLKKNAKGGVVTMARQLNASDLVNSGPDGIVRSKDGKILKGWKVGKDGTLYNAQGKKATAADVLLAEKGMRPGGDGAVIDKNGKVYHARDLVTVAKDGKVRTKDGTVLNGVHVGKDGKLYDKKGKLVTAQDIIERESAAGKSGSSLLSGVTARTVPVDMGESPLVQSGTPYDVEYIIGGGSDGSAKTFMVQVKDESEIGAQDEQ